MYFVHTRSRNALEATLLRVSSPEKALPGAELRRLIAVIGETLGVTPRIEQRPIQPGDVTRTFADISRARTELGYAPHVGIEEGVRRFVEWYLLQTGSGAPRPIA